MTNWKADLIDILILVVLYMAIEFGRTEQQPVTDWAAWLRAVGMGALYKSVPPLVQYLGLLRAKYGNPGV